mgnify:CR=1 FL=1
MGGGIGNCVCAIYAADCNSNCIGVILGGKGNVVNRYGSIINGTTNSVYNGGTILGGTK